MADARQILRAVFEEFHQGKIETEDFGGFEVLSAPLEEGTITLKTDRFSVVSILEVRTAEDKVYERRSFALRTRKYHLDTLEADFWPGGLDLSNPIARIILKIFARAVELTPVKSYEPIPND